MSLFGSGRKPGEASRSEKDGAQPDKEKARREPAQPGSSVRQRTDSARTTADEPDSRSRRDRRQDKPNTGAGGETMASFGKSIVFKGDLSGDEDLEIEGRVEGTVKLPGHQVTIGANGKVTAQVEAKNVVVIGHIAGNVTAEERVEVQATGVVDGDIQAPRLLIQEGAVVNGSISMGTAAAVAASPTKAPEPERKTG